MEGEVLVLAAVILTKDAKPEMTASRGTVMQRQGCAVDPYPLNSATTQYLIKIEERRAWMAVDHVPALGSDVDTVRVVKWTKIAILRLATTMNVLAALRAIQRTGWKQMLIGESHV